MLWFTNKLAISHHLLHVAVTLVCTTLSTPASVQHISQVAKVFYFLQHSPIYYLSLHCHHRHLPWLHNLDIQKFCTHRRFLRPEHHLWQHLLHSVQSTGFGPTPLPQYPHGHFPDWVLSLSLLYFQTTLILSFLYLFFSPLCSIPSFHLLNMSVTSFYSTGPVIIILPNLTVYYSKES